MAFFGRSVYNGGVNNCLRHDNRCTRRERCPQRSEREAQHNLHRNMKNVENLPIEVKFSDGTLGTAFPTDANINNNLSDHQTIAFFCPLLYNEEKEGSAWSFTLS